MVSHGSITDFGTNSVNKLDYLAIAAKDNFVLMFIPHIYTPESDSEVSGLVIGFRDDVTFCVQCNKQSNFCGHFIKNN